MKSAAVISLASLVVWGGVLVADGLRQKRKAQPDGRPSGTAIGVIQNRYQGWQAGLLEHSWTDACFLKQIEMFSGKQSNEECKCPVTKEEKLIPSWRRLPDTAKPYLEVVHRTRAINKLTEAWMQDKTNAQFVILGAGWDGRGYNFPALKKASVFELDLEGTQIAKKAMVEKCSIKPINEEQKVHYIPLDLAGGDPYGGLMKNEAFDPKRPTLFIQEAVAEYVPEKGNRKSLQMLHGLAKQNPESRFIFMAWKEPTKGNFINQMMDYSTALAGDPVKFFVPKEDKAWFAKTGWEPDKDTSYKSQALAEFYKNAPSDCYMDLFKPTTAAPEI